MGKIYLSTKNNLLKLQNSIKEYKNGQILIEEKELILKNKLESYKNSKLSQQREIKDFVKKDIWDKDAIYKRRKKLENFVLETWSFK